VRILIVDDEPVARARLVRLIERLEGHEVVGEAANGQEAITLARSLRPDVVLLDIDMPGIDGIAVAETGGMPPVIFTTAHRGHAVEAFEADAHDYILKPVARERLERALEKVRTRETGREPRALDAPDEAATDEAWRLVVIEGTLKRFVDAREVAMFLADEKYVTFRYRGAELLLRESLDTLEERLAAYGFVRPNRGALVRRGAIEAFDAADGGSLVLIGGERVPVSRRASAAIRAALGLSPS
jgi:DNA-binding LytR/AlgR family response regulator